MTLLNSVATKIGLRECKIFSMDTTPPYSNPYQYPLNENGVPLVPVDDVVKGGLIGERTIFSGGFIVNSGSNSFVVRSGMGGPNLQEGDKFAFQNSNPDRPPLVFEVTERKNNGSGSFIVKTKGIGFLDE